MPLQSSSAIPKCPSFPFSSFFRFRHSAIWISTPNFFSPLSLSARTSLPHPLAFVAPPPPLHPSLIQLFGLHPSASRCSFSTLSSCTTCFVFLSSPLLSSFLLFAADATAHRLDTCRYRFLLGHRCLLPIHFLRLLYIAPSLSAVSFI